MKNNRKVYRERWWQYAEKRPELYRTIQLLKRVLVGVQTSKYVSMCFQPVGLVYSHMTVVFAFDTSSVFAILNTSWHTEWIAMYCSSLETRLRYLPSDGFDTFPFPDSFEYLESIGERYYEERIAILLTRQEGLTKTYNRFHNPDKSTADIQKLRELHVEMDQAVAAAYGWTNFELRLMNWTTCANTS